MKKNTIFILLSIFIMSTSSVVLFYYGSSLNSKSVQLEPHGVLWLESGSIVEAEGLRVVWGVKAPPNEVPNYWRINITFKSNGTTFVRAYWDDPSNIMYENSGEFFKHTFDVKVEDPLIHNRWTWYLDNPNSYPVEIEEFIIEYSGIDKPHYKLGCLLIILGGLLISVQIPLIIIFKYQEIRGILSKIFSIY